MSRAISTKRLFTAVVNHSPAKSLSPQQRMAKVIRATVLAFQATNNENFTRIHFLQGLDVLLSISISSNRRFLLNVYFGRYFQSNFFSFWLLVTSTKGKRRRLLKAIVSSLCASLYQYTSATGKCQRCFQHSYDRAETTVKRVL